MSHKGLHIGECLKSPACKRVTHRGCCLPRRLRWLTRLADFGSRAHRLLFLFNCDVHKDPFRFSRLVYIRPQSDSTAKTNILHRANFFSIRMARTARMGEISLYRKSREEERKCLTRLTHGYMDGGAGICGRTRSIVSCFSCVSWGKRLSMARQARVTRIAREARNAGTKDRRTIAAQPPSPAAYARNARGQSATRARRSGVRCHAPATSRFRARRAP